MELPANIPAISFDNRIRYSPFVSEEALPAMMELVGRDLSEPYSIYTYRYFLQLPHSKFCFLVSVSVGFQKKEGIKYSLNTGK